MKIFPIRLGMSVVLLSLLCPILSMAEEVEPEKIVVNPREYAGKTVTTKVNFWKINNVFHGWENEANLKAGRTIKFIANPLREIACYADKTDENEKLLAGLKPGQKLTVIGYIKKCKMKAEVKGERRTFKRTVEGAEAYAFVVKKIESVGEPPAGSLPGMGGMRRMMKR
ncbi:MAG: hypothetical protein NTZ78_02340 [Candidatus Aureabacteria bacterium]|nr:hypothetical protein [Candidatus Auribacterota bacterium]